MRGGHAAPVREGSADTLAWAPRYLTDTHGSHQSIPRGGRLTTWTDSTPLPDDSSHTSTNPRWGQAFEGSRRPARRGAGRRAAALAGLCSAHTSGVDHTGAGAVRERAKRRHGRHLPDAPREPKRQGDREAEGPEGGGRGRAVLSPAGPDSRRRRLGRRTAHGRPHGPHARPVRGGTFSSLEEGGDHAGGVGSGEITERCARAAGHLPGDVLHAGPCCPPSSSPGPGGARWARPRSVPVSPSRSSAPPGHAAYRCRSTRRRATRFSRGHRAARALVAGHAGTQLFPFPGDQHLFADASPPSDRGGRGDDGAGQRRPPRPRRAGGVGGGLEARSSTTAERARAERLGAGGRGGSLGRPTRAGLSSPGPPGPAPPAVPRRAARSPSPPGVHSRPRPATRDRRRGRGPGRPARRGAV
ncbi:hypothetical protein SDIAM103S_05270 [Streptomyces diastaticus subsp. diastaticus]